MLNDTIFIFPCRPLLEWTESPKPEGSSTDAFIRNIPNSSRF